MLMSESDKMQIKNRGIFLVQKGYRVSTDEYGVNFDNGRMKIDVFYERYENHQDILLKFPSRKGYYLHFFALRIEKMDLRNATPLQMLFAYMDYLERNYDNLMNEEYCEQCMEIVRQDMETLIEVPIYNNISTGEKEMNNKNIIETPEDKKKGNFWSWISLACFAGGFVADALMAVFMGVLNSITYNLTSTANAYEVANTASEALIAIAGCVSMLLAIAALVIMIYVRVKYPKNIFGKVLMWVYIVLFVMYVLFMVAMIIACGIACAACTEECQGLAMLTVERWMLC